MPLIQLPFLLKLMAFVAVPVIILLLSCFMTTPRGRRCTFALEGTSRAGSKQALFCLTYRRTDHIIGTWRSEAASG